ncbi:pyrroline-5-carboxylate reductase [Brachyspira aalborgi]|uniref:Pyrroline-5-carboxylate reductase n=1 Tax=Brachyspira aalborgi TaxID=29522 RepID=A0AB38Q390_9SPIR|nr:pyrroline-5-carboxylate reductase [Brachyspira aalborgi]TXJ28625.1 pyrroline-5-carboxylate reductase [Brachyspira aalborgi]
MKIGFIGAGSMGGALIEGFIKSGIDKKNIIASVKTKEKKESLEKNIGIKVYNDNKKVARESDILFIAVKPYMFENISKEIKSNIKKETTIISVAASIKNKELIKLFETKKIIRIMPNTPVKTCNGFIAVVESDSIEKKIIDLLSKIAMFKIIPENLIHSYTAISGCSPAFLYILIEAMSDAGVIMGIDRKSSIETAAQLFKSVGAMVLESKKHPAELKDAVCTPAGITIKGVEKLEEKALRSGLIETILSSYNKSIESEEK